MLTEQQLNDAVTAYNVSGGDLNKAAGLLGLSPENYRYRLGKSGISHKKPPPQFVGDERARRVRNIKGDAFILTAAQNDTRVHEKFWENLQAFADKMDATLLVRKNYHNPTIGSAYSRDEPVEKPPAVWAPMLSKYLTEQNLRLGDSGFVFMGAVNINQTASRPLTGFNLEPPGEHGIFASPRIQLTTVPTPDWEEPLLRATTGFCTVRNYSDTKLGIKGDIHHVYGAAFVCGGKVFQLIADSKTGSFYWLDHKAEDGKVTTGHRVEAMVLGDIHAHESIYGQVLDKTVEYIELLRPKTLVVHDLLDGHSISHHRRRSVLDAMIQRQENFEGGLQEELQECWAVLHQLHDACKSQILVVASNHDEWLSRYLECDWRGMPANEAIPYLKLALAVAEYANGINDKFSASYRGDVTDFNALAVMMGREKWVRFLRRSDSVKIKEIEVAVHGDKGSGGTRGSASHFGKFASKMIVGHSHSPAIVDGCYQVGTSTPRNVQYNRGYGTWENAHALIYPSGKRSLLFL